MRKTIYADTVVMDEYRSAWYSGQYYVYDSQVPYVSSRHDRIRWDIVTPNFRKLQAQGAVINNAYALADYTESATPILYGGTGWNTNPTLVEVETRGHLLTTSTTFPSMDYSSLTYFMGQISELRASTVSQAWANVDVSEMQALASLGELPETVRWFVSLMNRMLSILRAFRNKKAALRKLQNLTKTELADSLANLWLELRFAVRPLVYDAKAAVKAMQSVVKKGTRNTARGYDSQITKDVTEYTFVEGNRTFPTVSEVNTSINLRAGVLFDIDSDINGILSLWGLDQPFEAIWELIPFSFIIDWFFNIGDIIAGWSLNPSLRPLASWVTEQLTLQEVVTCDVYAPGPTWFYNLSGPYVTQSGKLTKTLVLKVRTPDPDRQILPSFDLNLNWAKLVDLSAIGRTLYRGLLHG